MPTVLGKLLARSGLHDLGMHTELCSDAYLDLYEAGVLTNRRCTLHRGQGMLGIVLGSKRLYDWVARSAVRASSSTFSRVRPWPAAARRSSA